MTLAGSLGRPFRQRVAQHRNLVLGAALLLVVGLNSAFVLPQPPPTPPNTVNGSLYNLPDPASVATNLSGQEQELYATGTSAAYNDRFGNSYTGTGENLPSQSWEPTLSPSTYPDRDVLADLSCHGSFCQNYNALQPNAEAAPSVVFLNNEYVMWFTAYNANSAIANCLDVAVSSPSENAGFATSTGPFQIINQYCDPSGNNYGFFDPSIRVQSDGSVWLVYAQEHGQDPTSNAVYSTPLTADGTQMQNGARYLLATNSDMPQQEQLGDNVQLESPSFAVDPQPGQNSSTGATNPDDLLVSYGTYDRQGDYHTFEMGCPSITTQCDDTHAQLEDGQIGGSGSGLNNTAGLSLTSGAGPGGTDSNDGRGALFAADNGSRAQPRGLFAEATNQPLLYAEPTLDDGQYLNAGQNLVNPNTHWQLSMQTDGNLVLYDQNHTARWNSRITGGDANAYAIMQSDGNLVTYDNGRATFNTQTNGQPGAYLILQNDNNLVIYSPNHTALFNTGT